MALMVSLHGALRHPTKPCPLLGMLLNESEHCWCYITTSLWSKVFHLAPWVLFVLSLTDECSLTLPLILRVKEPCLCGQLGSTQSSQPLILAKHKSESEVKWSVDWIQQYVAPCEVPDSLLPAEVHKNALQIGK